MTRGMTKVEQDWCSKGLDSAPEIHLTESKRLNDDFQCHHFCKESIEICQVEQGAGEMVGAAFKVGTGFILRLIGSADGA